MSTHDNGDEHSIISAVAEGKQKSESPKLIIFHLFPPLHTFVLVSSRCVAAQQAHTQNASERKYLISRPRLARCRRVKSHFVFFIDELIHFSIQLHLGCKKKPQKPPSNTAWGEICEQQRDSSSKSEQRSEVGNV